MRKLTPYLIIVLLSIFAGFMAFQLISMAKEIRTLKQANSGVNDAYLKQLDYNKSIEVEKKDIQKELDGLKVHYKNAQVTIVELQKKVKGKAKQDEEKKDKYEVDTKYIKGWFDIYGNYDLGLTLDGKIKTVETNDGTYTHVDGGEITTNITYNNKPKKLSLHIGYLSPDIALCEFRIKSYNIIAGVGLVGLFKKELDLHVGLTFELF